MTRRPGRLDLAEFPGDGAIRQLQGGDGRWLASCPGCSWERVAQTRTEARVIRGTHTDKCKPARAFLDARAQSKLQKGGGRR